jgi:hypothetical protein
MVFSYSQTIIYWELSSIEGLEELITDVYFIPALFYKV